MSQTSASTKCSRKWVWTGCFLLTHWLSVWSFAKPEPFTISSKGFRCLPARCSLHSACPKCSEFPAPELGSHHDPHLETLSTAGLTPRLEGPLYSTAPSSRSHPGWNFRGTLRVLTPSGQLQTSGSCGDLRLLSTCHGLYLGGVFSPGPSRPLLGKGRRQHGAWGMKIGDQGHS